MFDSKHFVLTRTFRRIFVKANLSLVACIAALQFAPIATASNPALVAQFNSCASQAIAEKSISAKNINVQLPSFSEEALDHDSSASSREYVMDLINPQTGQGLGRVSCRVSSEGAVQSVKLLSKR